ncbi:Exosome complex component RRP42 [Quaeritorhiza haematococci]|nr:Exosome complex component RRP42 [Quaeritorhiza haematococci]
MAGLISASERDYITKGVECGIRADGRGRLDPRQLYIESGMITQASGSCRVRRDTTDVLVGVKVEIGSIEQTVSDYVDGGDNPAGLEADGSGGAEGEVMESGDLLQSGGLDKNRGKVICTVECSPSATRVFDLRELEDLCTEYSQFMNRLFNGPHSGIDLKSLCIIPGSTCWVVYVDALVLDYGGNLLDTIVLATRGALLNTRIAKCTVEEVGTGDGGPRYEFDVADEETEPVKGAADLPVCLTLSKIGSHHILDATPLEEICTQARVVIAVNRKGTICSMQKGGHGGVDPSLLAQMIQSAKTMGPSLISKMDAALKEEDSQRRKQKNSGVRRL